MAEKSLMVIAAHCDDIELNFAGTMFKYHEKFGYDIIYVQSTNNMSGLWSEATAGEHAGLSKLPGWIAEKKTTPYPGLKRLTHLVPWYYEIQQRKKEAADAARDCFHTVPIHLDYAQRHYTDRDLKKIDLRYGAPAPDCYDPAVPTIMTACDDPAQIERVAKLILDKDPEVIFTHPAVDYTFEHTGTTLLVQKAFCKAERAGYKGSLICAAAPGKNNMGRFFDRWDSFIDTTGLMQKKMEAVGKHACQISYPDHVCFFDPYAGKICGCETAETYVVVRLSAVRSGALTRELARNHKFCNENWMKLFFSKASEVVFEDFDIMCRRKQAHWEKLARQKTAPAAGGVCKTARMKRRPARK
ncbi:MAG: PIG-L family deacetylase [Kiritimatiellia bacterium]